MGRGVGRGESRGTCAVSVSGSPASYVQMIQTEPLTVCDSRAQLEPLVEHAAWAPVGIDVPAWAYRSAPGPARGSETSVAEPPVTSRMGAALSLAAEDGRLRSALASLSDFDPWTDMVADLKVEAFKRDLTFASLRALLLQPGGISGSESPSSASSSMRSLARAPRARVLSSVAFSATEPVTQARFIAEALDPEWEAKLADMAAGVPPFPF